MAPAWNSWTVSRPADRQFRQRYFPAIRHFSPLFHVFDEFMSHLRFEHLFWQAHEWVSKTGTRGPIIIEG
jgi:hypothetical protein